MAYLMAWGLLAAVVGALVWWWRERP